MFVWEKIKLYGSKVLGILFIVTGFFGLFLPILQGFAMIAFGLWLLGGELLLKKFQNFFKS